MTNEPRSPHEIEREIEEQRSDLTSNLEDLQDKFSIDTVVRQISDQFREHGGDMGRAISNQVKANPIPLALTGIGLAWMMFGNAQKSTPSSRSYDESSNSSVERDFRRTQLAQGRPYTPPTAQTPQYDNDPSWAREDHGSVAEKLSTAAAEVKDKVSQGASTVSEGVAAAGAAVSDGAATAKSKLASGAQAVRDGAAATGARIAEGTEALSEEGRQRVIAARQKAIEMRRSASRSMRDGADAASDFYDRQPLVVGALAIAVGAALGGALPRSKTEDDIMGAHSDTLFDQAERIFAEEKSKAMAVAQSVKDEVKDIASETKADLDTGAPGDKSAAEAIGDKAKSAAVRVADKAQASAKDENLGKPKT